MAQGKAQSDGSGWRVWLPTPAWLSLLCAWGRNLDAHGARKGIGVRGGGSRGEAAPRVWKFLGKTLFSGQAQVAQKSSMIKITYSIQWKIPGKLCLSGLAQVAQKSWMIENTYSIQWKIPGQTLFFRASASCSKILNNKKYIFSTVNSGHPMFFRASTSCSKVLIVKSIFHIVKNSRANSVFQGKRKLLKNPE